MSKKNGKVYFMGAYCFESQPPFALKKITPGPLASVDNYRVHNPKKVMFPGGMIVKGDQIHVLWGRNDSKISLSTFDKEKLISCMIDCN